MTDFNYFVVKSDQHIVEPGTLLNGIDTNTRAIQLVDKIKSETVKIEAVVDLGDLADTTSNPNRSKAEATPEAYDHAATIIKDLSGIQLFIPGNHDDPNLLYSRLGNQWQFVDNDCRTYDFGKVKFISVDVRTGPEPTGFVSDETLDSLSNILVGARKAIVFMHYSCLTSDNVTCNETLGITNVSKLQELFENNKDKILAVFHGHLHVWWSGVMNGIPVYCSTGSAFAFSLEPQSSEREKIVEIPRGYYLVGVSDNDELVVRPRFVS